MTYLLTTHKPWPASSRVAFATKNRYVAQSDLVGGEGETCLLPLHEFFICNLLSVKL